MKELFTFSSQFTFDTELIDENTTVIIGFSGFGSVGRLAVNHIVETFDVKAIGYWGPVSWFHNGRLESPVTIYQLNLKSDDPNEKFILISSRLNVPVIGYNALPDIFWKLLSKEILSWKAKRYIAIGGLREEIRESSDSSWVALIPSPRYTKLYGTQRTFKDHLSIKGPISYLLMESTAFSYPTLAVLSYCNTFDADIEAALIALKELETHLNIDLKSQNLNLFDFSFIEPDSMLFWEEEDEYDEFLESTDEDLFDEFDEEEGTPKYSDTGGDTISFDVYKEFQNKGDKLDKYK
ncbi:MAG: PAC2 family protein [Candidatus Heimdallarchaeaceae archaeon]